MSERGRSLDDFAAFVRDEQMRKLLRKHDRTARPPCACGVARPHEATPVCR